MNKLYAFLPVVLAIFSGCGSAHTGTYHGTEAGTETLTSGKKNFTQKVEVTLIQKGVTISGTWSDESGEAGSVSGRVDGEEIKDFSIKSTGKCEGVYTGSVTIKDYADATHMTGTIQGNSVCGAISATIDGTRDK